VTCQETTRIIGLYPRNGVLPPEAIAHIAGCDNCVRLMGLFDAGLGGGSAQPDLWKAIQSEMARDLKPVRPLARPAVYVLTFAVIFLAVLVVALASAGTADGWDALSTGQKAAVFTVLAVSCGLLIISLVRQMAPGSPDPISPTVLLAGVPAVLVLAIAVVFRPRPEPEFLSNGATCFRIGLSYSIPALFILWIVARRGAMLRPWLTGTVLGGLAGLTGLSILEMNCSNLNLYHILVWHGGVVVAGALGGGALTALHCFRTQRNSTARAANY
jgi:hypothetical protein